MENILSTSNEMVSVRKPYDTQAQETYKSTLHILINSTIDKLFRINTYLRELCNFV